MTDLHSTRCPELDGGLHRDGQPEFAQRGANFSSGGSSICMGVSIGHRPGRETTRAHLERIAGGGAALKIRRQVLGWSPGATEEQVEEAFQEACVRAERSCHCQVEAEVYTWLRTATHRCLLRMRERREREPIADQPYDDLDPNDLCAPGADTVVLEREKHAEVADVAKVVLEHLSARQLDVAALHARGFRRREIAERTQLSPRAVKRLMEQVLTIGRAELAELAGHGCEAGHEQVARYAFGLARPREAAVAQLHLATCERCGAMYERLDLWREKVAALLPAPPVVDAHTHVIERVVQSASDLVAGAPTHAEVPTGFRRHASDALAHLREHAAAAYYRTVDPTPLAGARPGAMAAAIASCVAIGGGATYCVKQGADPITALSGLNPSAEHDKPKRAVKRAQAAQPAAPAPSPPAPVAAPPPPATPPPPPPPPPATKTQPALPPAPEDEFEPTNPVASSTSSAASSTPAASTKTAEPAPAPADGPGEFGGP